ncbi:conserved hypothetical protein [Roseibium sp. TrichSKD4]|nr:conserved hypothetical protein [Roseibium sp. TrichSKD4]
MFRQHSQGLREDHLIRSNRLDFYSSLFCQTIHSRSGTSKRSLSMDKRIYKAVLLDPSGKGD